MGTEAQALNELVDAFAEAMKLKLKDKLLAGWSGWDDLAFEDKFRARLLVHTVGDGQRPADFVDVANLAAFIWNLNGRPER